MTLRTLADLKPLHRHLQDQARLARLAPKRLPVEHPVTQALSFAQAVGPISPLPPHGRHVPVPHRPLPVPQQRQYDEQRVMQEALSDAFDAETLLLTDEHLSFRRPGLGVDVVRRLRAGEWTMQAELDLHGQRSHEARQALVDFLHEARRRGLRCVRIVHGKGLGSPGKTPVLKSKVHSWLAQKNEVMAFVQARPADGGAGALVVLLRPAPRQA